MKDEKDQSAARLFPDLTGPSAGPERTLSTAELAVEVRRRIEELRPELARIMRPETIDRWMEMANPALDGLSPRHVVEDGESYRIRNLISYLELGMMA